ncbi:hypothetical protein [Frankia sp. R43]|uniref:hypothetical protein n=1 Tax=Frankia sp. R43 TaxID=269536 RepID=UPI0006CA57D0|nr:hypothetical protein [Frankia sp. R43]
MIRARRPDGARWRAAAALLATLAVLLVGLAPPSSATKPPGAAVGTRLDTYYDEPIFRQALFLRLAANRAQTSFQALSAIKNVAVEIWDPRTVDEGFLKGIFGQTVGTKIDNSIGAALRVDTMDLATARKYIGDALYRELAKAGYSRVYVASALSRTNVDERSSTHSEEALQQIRVRMAGVTKKAVAVLHGGSERQQCPRCAPIYPSSVPTSYLEPYGLTIEETAQRQAKLAKVDHASGSEETKKAKKAAINAEYDAIDEARAAQARGNLQVHLDTARDNYERDVRAGGVAAQEIFHTTLSGDCPGKPQGLGPLVVRAVLAAGCGGQGTKSTGLADALAGADLDPGGVDFTTLELRYLSDSGSGLEYAFNARRDPLAGDPRASTGLTVAQETSDAFFVWLALDPSTFWVNLSPNEPDRIVDAELGRTDVGRILLEADLRMKQTSAELIHPDTALGQEYWARSQGGCLTERNWIVPAPASVREDGDSLYILDAPLDVQTEATHTLPGGTGTAGSCPGQDPAVTAAEEELYRTLVLPKLKEQINTAPEYADLRRVYLARIAAEWYRARTLRHHATYADVIDSGDVDRWTTESGWKPRDTFDAYVRSYREGEFDLTRQVESGGVVTTYRYFYGGVDFSHVPMRAVDAAESDRVAPGLPEAAQASVTQAAPGQGDEIWLGGAVRGKGRGALERVGDALSGLAYSSAGLALLVVAGLVLLSFGFWGPRLARRRRPR